MSITVASTGPDVPEQESPSVVRARRTLMGNGKLGDILLRVVA